MLCICVMLEKPNTDLDVTNTSKPKKTYTFIDLKGCVAKSILF